MSRVFYMILDSFGIGVAPDAADFGDIGSSTIRSVAGSAHWDCPNLMKLGLFNIDGVHCTDAEALAGEEVYAALAENPAWSRERWQALRKGCAAPIGSFARMRELSKGKDTVIGHWELAGIVSERPMPTFPDGFPADFIRAFEERTGRKCIVNKPYSGTDIIRDFGVEQHETGALIVYTSADSVFQIAANEADIPVEELYRYCAIAREMLTGDLAVGRVIARPYVGDSPENYVRTSNRHDYAISPFAPTLPDELKGAGKDVIGVGKINDIFNGQGITEFVRTKDNADGLLKTSGYQEKDFDGLCFVNLVETDSVYGHRRNIDGYADAVSAFDRWLTDFMPGMRQDDMLIISADHGCDPGYPAHTDHTREYVEFLMYGAQAKRGKNFGTVDGFTFAADRIREFLLH